MVVVLDHFERTVALLASQFQLNKPDGSLTNFQKVLKALVVPAQQIEDVNYQLLTLRWLSTAQGVQLDEIGVILGLVRNLDESDEDYRERLQFQIFINTSSGTPEQAMQVLQFLTQASHISYFEIPSAFYMMETNGLKFPNPPNELNEAIKRVSPAGVNYVPITAVYDFPIVFSLGQDLSNQPLFVSPDENNYSELVNLEMEPYNSILYVSTGSFGEDEDFIGGLDELNYPLPTAGQIGELIQINSNFPALI